MKCSRLRKIILICLLSFSCLISSGCWNRKEIETLAFVIAVGIDSSPKGFLVSTQVANTAALTKQGVMNAPNFFVYSDAGKTVFDAVRTATHSSPNKLFWSHTKVLVVSEELARKGLKPALDFFARDAEERRNFLLAVTPQSGKDIVSADVKTTTIPAITLSELLEAYKYSSQTAYINLNDYIREQHSTISSLVPEVRIVKNQGANVGYKVYRAAVIKKNKFISYLTRKETRGALWILGKVKSGIVDTKCLGKSKNSKERIAFEIYKSDAKVKVKKKSGQYMINVDIKEQGNIAEASCTKNEIDPKKIKKMEKMKAEAIKKEIKASLKKAQELNTDYFGFGEIIHRSYPKDWKKIEKKWDKIFPTLKVKIKVETKITSDALIERKPQK
ncbi:Ger(x)C family spore germination protein [Bacillus sp. RG28]|uniref:Ger(X)C family spore germination protein n=1 Tax=Gottfriedia endophytica TaxID=2820819 RepID=A0A940NIV2_9BACI|nr:Ger(x)C family spore germination protein [Gottfriedia endophytica]MBP0725155.1 Ger(x)C family spore germination protein [Gottfriedia endophytica]